MTKAHHSVKKKHVHVDPPYVTNFIDAHKDVAQKLGKQYNIPASVLLAQSCSGRHDEQGLRGRAVTSQGPRKVHRGTSQTLRHGQEVRTIGRLDHQEPPS